MDYLEYSVGLLALAATFASIVWMFDKVTDLFASFILGVYNSARDGMILEGWRIWTLKKFGKYWGKPFFRCVKCMASIWAGIPALIILGILNYLSFSWALLSGSPLLLIFFVTVVSSKAGVLQAEYEVNFNKAKTIQNTGSYDEKVDGIQASLVRAKREAQKQ